MRVCLINPPSPFLLDSKVFPPLGLLQVAASLERKGHCVSVLDLADVSKDDLFAAITTRLSEPWDVFGLTATTPQFPHAVEILKMLRQYSPKQRVVIGGPHATVMPDSCDLFDCVVLGDGEEAILEAILPESRHVIDQASGVTKGLLKYILPARHLIDMNAYKYKLAGRKGTSVLTEAGCPFNCVAASSFVTRPEGIYHCKETLFEQQQSCGMGHEHSLGTFGDASVVTNGEKECCEIELRNGLSLTVTHDHRVLRVENERLVFSPAKSLKVGDFLVLGVGQNTVKEEIVLSEQRDHVSPNEKVVRIPSVLNEDLGWVLGFLIGNGCLPSDGRPVTHFAVNADNGTENELRSRLESLFGYSGTWAVHSSSDRCLVVWVNSRRIRDFFEKTLGVSCTDKLHVPKLIRRSPAHVAQAFISGLMAADQYQPDDHGAGQRLHPYLTTKSKDFALEVALLSLWIGRGASVHRGSFCKNGDEGVAWRVSLCFPECWTDIAGHPCWTSSVPLNNRRVYRSPKSGRLYWRTNTGRAQSGITRTMLSEIEQEHPLLARKAIYVPIVKIRDVGVQAVIDVASHPKHEFTASGMVLANCSFCCGRSTNFYRRVRTRDPDEFVQELVHLQETYGIMAAMDFSDEINLLSEPLLTLCSKIKPLGMKFRAFVKANIFDDRQAEAMAEAGFVELNTGVESGDDRILGIIDKKTTRVINKNFVDLCKKHGIRSKTFMSLAQAGETRESVQNTKEWLLWARPDDFDVTVVSVYPATPYWDQREFISVSADGQRICRYVKKSKNKNENGATLFFEEVDYSQSFSWYKGRPGEYISHVWTPDLTKEDLVTLRDQVEDDVRKELGIPYPKRYSGDYLEDSVDRGTNFEHSVGQGLSPQDSRVQLREG